MNSKKEVFENDNKKNDVARDVEKFESLSESDLRPYLIWEKVSDKGEIKDELF